MIDTAPFAANTQDFLLRLARQIPTTIDTELASDWIEKNIVVTEGMFTGPYSFRTTPYLREIAESLSIRSGVTEVAVIKGNQLGFSILSFAVMLYYVAHGVGPQLFVSGDATMAEESFEKRLDPMIEAAGMRDLIRPAVKKAGSRTTGDVKAVKSYAGTFMRAVGPNTEGKLRSFPSRVNIIEEVDVFPQLLRGGAGGDGGAGNPIQKILRRADHFGSLRRIYYNSTPKQRATSQIEPLYESGDKRLYTFCCPACGHRQPFVWGGFKWDKKPDGSPAVEIDDGGRVVHNPVYYRCASCERRIEEHEKFQLLLDEKAGGTARWEPTKKPDRPGLRSYKLPAFYSPTRSWLDIVLQFWEVKDDGLRLPDFQNDVLAETSENTITKPDEHYLAARAEDWEFGHVPNKVLFTTLAADVQGDRIEAGLVGWSWGRECWVLNYFVFFGDTEDLSSSCWSELARAIDTVVTRSDGVSLGTPSVAFIDAGYLTVQVETFCAGFQFNKQTIDSVYPVQGHEQLGQSIFKEFASTVAQPKIGLADQKLKHEIYSRLSRPAPPPGGAYPVGFIHFPATLGAAWYKQLTAEEHVVNKSKLTGRVVSRVVNLHNRRNEALDVLKMNLGACYFVCLKMFALENEGLRRRGRKERLVDWEAFWQSMENRLEKPGKG